MALAEILVEFIDEGLGELDYEEGAADDNKFSTIILMIAPRESIQWLRDYLSNTLSSNRENAVLRANHVEKWGVWFEEKDWIHWQEDMSSLIKRLNAMLGSMGSSIELPPTESRDWIWGRAREGLCR